MIRGEALLYCSAVVRVSDLGRAVTFWLIDKGFICQSQLSFITPNVSQPHLNLGGVVLSFESKFSFQSQHFKKLLILIFKKSEVNYFFWKNKWRK